MPNQSNQPDRLDASIDRTLAALRSTAPPEGMEARILQTLDAQLTEERVVVPALRTAWLRGAFAGALVATAACIALFFIIRTQHAVAPQTTPIATAQPSSTATPVALHTGAPCPGSPSVRGRQDANGWDEKSIQVPHPSSAWMGSEGPTSHAPHLISASFAPSKPAPPAPLTAQERALLHLVRTASPTQLATLAPAAQRKSDAERQKDFETFFAASPEIRAIDEAQRKALGIPDDEPAPTNSTKEGQL